MVQFSSGRAKLLVLHDLILSCTLFSMYRFLNHFTQEGEESVLPYSLDGVKLNCSYLTFEMLQFSLARIKFQCTCGSFPKMYFLQIIGTGHLAIYSLARLELNCIQPSLLYPAIQLDSSLIVTCKRLSYLEHSLNIAKPCFSNPLACNSLA